MRIGRRRDNNSLGGRNILIGMVVVTMVCGALNLLLGGRVEAFTCNDVVNTLGEATGGKIFNPSLYSACALVHPENQYSQGAMWINSDEKSWAAIVKLSKDHQVHSYDVFVNGAVLKEMENKDAYAECIRIYKKSNNKIVENMLSYDNWGYNNSFGSCDNVANADSSLMPFKGNRVLRRPNNKTPWTSQITQKRSRSVQLDLSTLNSLGATPTVNGGHIVYDNVKLDVFRCWRDIKEEKSDGQLVLGNRGACGASPSTLAIEGDVFYGKSYVWRTEDGKSSGINTGEVYTGSARANTATLVLDNCEEGCKVSFQHELKKTGYNFNHRVSYDVKNETNRTISSEGWKRQLQLGTVMGGNLSPAYGFNTGNNYTRYFPANAFEIVLYPGEIYCSEFNFGLYVAKDANDQSERSSHNAGLRACAKAKGTLATSVSLKINNKKENVYIKPSDSVSLQVDYVSNPQKAFGLGFRRVELSGSEMFTQDKWSTKLGAVLSGGGRPGWENRFFVYKNSTKLKDVNYESGTKCGTSIFSVERTQMGDDWRCSLEDKSISGFEVGKSYDFYAKTSNKTPKRIRIGSSGSYLVVRPDIGELKSSHVNVVVPYNFVNDTKISKVGKKGIDYNDNGNDVVTKSEEIEFEIGANTITYGLFVGEKENGLVKDKYATMVPNAKSGIEWCRTASESECDPSPDKSVLGSNESNSLSPGQYTRSAELSLSEESDVQIGDIVCVRSWMTPGNSGSDDNTNSNWLEGNKAYSKRVCGRVAKSPALQVWGGNVFSEGELSVNGTFRRTFGSDTRYYGSFGELGVFAKNSGYFASGAALGYGGLNGSRLLPKYGFDDKDERYTTEEMNVINSRKWYGGGDNADGNLKNNYGSRVDISTISSEILKKLCNGEGELLTNGGQDVSGGKECFDEGTGSVGGEGPELSLGSGQKAVIYNSDNSGSIEIKSNLIYRNDNTDKYNTLSEIPKWIIISEGDIDISCNVTRIDGLLIAGGTVNTCKVIGNEEKDQDINNEEHSNQLIVNGAIIANKLVAKRTYGAGPDVYSIVPAEIIMFDPSLYGLGAEGGEINPKIVNVTELAPRY